MSVERSGTRARLALLLIVAFAPACRRESNAPEAPAIDVAAHRAEVEAWKARRDERLRAEDGWLTLVNLAWLERGSNPIGAAALPGQGVPAEVGTIWVSPSDDAEFRPAPGAGVTLDGAPVSAPIALVSDTDGPPTTLAVGSVRFHLVERNGRLAVRVKDTASPIRAAFEGMEYFPIDPAWRLAARFEPYDPPKRVQVPNVLGWMDDSPSPGVAVFEKDGATYRLEPILEEGQTNYFYIFGDRTNGIDTYGAGRFLYSEPPGPDGTVVLDFNKAYNPPCVFSAYATCPLPTPQNKLPIPVLAGEKKYTGPSAGPTHA